MSKLTFNFFKLFCAMSMCITGAAMAVCPPPGITISGAATQASQSQVAIADDGTAISVWQEFDGNDMFIRSSSFDGVSWSAPSQIATFTPFGGVEDTSVSPQIAVSGTSGNAVAIWEQLELSGNSAIYASVRPADTEVWEPPMQLDIGTITVQPFRNQQIAINTVGPNDDYAVAIWQTDNGSNIFLQSARLHILGFTPQLWSSPPDEVVPATTDSLITPQIVVDTTGIAYAIWENSNIFSIETSTLPLDGSVWSPPITLSPGIGTQRYQQPSIALGSTGFVAASWRQRVVPGSLFVQATTYELGSWDLTPDTISTGSTSVNSIDMDADFNNNVAVIWQEGNVPRNIKSSYRPFATGIWSAIPLQVSPIGQDSILPDITLIAGNAYAVWSTRITTDFIVEFSTSINGGSWTAPCTNLSALNEISASAHIAISPTGDGVIVWDNDDGISRVIQATSFIVPTGPPTVTSVSPTSGSLNGQNSVLITGTNFADVQFIEFGPNNFVFAPNFIVISPTQILAVAPSGPLAPPAVDVIVTNSIGPSPANPGDLYSFIDPICWQR